VFNFPKSAFNFPKSAFNFARNAEHFSVGGAAPAVRQMAHDGSPRR